MDVTKTHAAVRRSCLSTKKPKRPTRVHDTNKPHL